MVEVCRAITKHHYLVQNARDIARIVKEAFHIASTGRPGPVLIDVPKDIQNTLVPDPDYDVAMDLPGYRLPPPPSPRRSARSGRDQGKPQADHLLRRRRRSPRTPRKSCASSPPRPGIPVAMTLHGLGVDPQRPLPVARHARACTARSTPTTRSTTPTCCWPSAFASTTASPASSASSPSTAGSSTSTSTPRRSTRTRPRTSPSTTDVKSFLTAINPLVEPGDWRDWHQQLDAWRTSDPMTYDQRDDAILPQYVIDQFSKLRQGRIS